MVSPLVSHSGSALFAVLGLVASALLAAAAPAAPGARVLTLQELRDLVLARNESVQAKLLEVEINRRKARGEFGAFEPELFGGASREANKRENTAEQARSQLTDRFTEQNNIYQGGLETLVPTGAKVRLGYTLRDLKNSLQGTSFLGSPRGGTNGEYQTFFGLSATQPLLKNAWYPANLAGIRMAAIASDIAFQDYRRQLMLVVSTAEASYWNLYMAQEQVRFFQESVVTAEKILNDNRERQKAGVGSELDVLESEAGLALRRSKLSDAEQKLYEASNRVIALYAESVTGSNRLVRAVDRPEVGNVEFGYFDAWKSAYESNPDYLMQRQKLMQESVRVAYAKNQRLPELDLKGSYGLNGLGQTPGQSWEDIESRGFPSWSIGLEMRFPLAGGIKGRNELAAARLREREAQVSLKEVETQIANALDTALHKLNSTRDSVQSYQTVVGFNQHLLDAALARLEVGKVESRKVLDIEADLFEARNSQVDALVQFKRAGLEFDLMAGAILKKRNLELTRKDLETRTAQLLRDGQLTDEQYRDFIQGMQASYEQNALPPKPFGTPAQERAREAMDRLNAVWPATNSPPVLLQSNLPPAKLETNQAPAAIRSERDQKMFDALRKKLEELKP